MPRRTPHHVPGFTLLEICIAISIALLMVTMAVPSLKAVLKQNKTQDSFNQFDKLAQGAHSRSVSEQRAYVVMETPNPDKTDEMKFFVRPDVPANEEEMAGIEQISVPTDEAPIIEFRASLLKDIPAAIWVFWPNGCCEPATVKYSGKSGKWTAIYNPFTVQAELTNE